MKWPGNMITPFSQWVDNFFNEEDPFFREMRSTWANMPAVNVRETEDSYEIEVAAPGMTREDFKVSVEHGMMSIRAERRMETEDSKDDYIRKEFNYTTFERNFNLPDDVLSDKVAAKYDNGILRITMPRKAVKVTKDARLIDVG